jgi:hypothetical protein
MYTISRKEVFFDEILDKQKAHESSTLPQYHGAQADRPVSDINC